MTNIGGDFEAGNAEESNIAIRGTTGRLHVESNGLYGYGGVFEAVRSANDNIGVWTSSDGSGRNTNYGIYASAPIGTCHDGGAGSCTDAAGYFNGDVYTTSHAYFTSDANLKDNI